MVLVLFFCAPIIANYYQSKVLVLPLRVYSISLLFGAFNSIQIAKLQREMRFKSMMWAGIASTALAGIVGVTMAYFGCGLWSLVVYNGIYVVFSCFIMSFIARWRPSLAFSWGRAKGLFGFGWKMLVSALLCSLYNDARSLIIGKKYSTEDLGYYNRGEQFPWVISNALDVSIQSVMFPTMASAQDDKVRVKAILKRSLKLGNLIIVPIMIGLALVAKPVIVILLTEKWIPAVFFMQMMCVAYVQIPNISSNLIAIKAIGRSDVYMKLEIVRRVVMLAVLLISVFCFQSVEAIVIGGVISAWLDYLIVVIPIKRLLNYGLLEQIKDLWKTFVCVAIMAAVVYALSFLPLTMIPMLIVQVLSGVLVYVGACALLKVESFYYCLGIVKNLFRKEKNEE
jgi:O-antigen/teichoic acid export membrane protein